MFHRAPKKHRKAFAVGSTSIPSVGKAVLGGLSMAPLAILDQFIDRNYEVGTEALPADNSQVVEKSLDTFLNSVIPVKVQNWLKANQNVEIKTLQVGRTPLKQWVNTALNIITAGQWNKVKKEVGYDKLFHLYLIINGKWLVEKNEVFNVKAYSSSSGEEKIEIPVAKPITIGEMFSNVKNPENFYSNYDAFNNSCQDAVLYLLQQNNQSFNVTADVKRFIKQDVSNLLQNQKIRESTKTIKTITNIGATMNKLLQYVSGGKLSFARGGIIQGHTIQFA
jgi:NADPH-dependent 7-cyano-7-deazaguanine reductase QueF-like protein